MKPETSIVLVVLTLLATACDRPSDAEYLKDLQTRQLQICVTSLPEKVRALSATAARSVCTCGFDRLLAHHPLKMLRKMDEAGDKAGAEKIMQPIMKECIEAEIARR